MDSRFGFTADVDAGDGTKGPRSSIQAAAFIEQLTGPNLGLFCEEVGPVSSDAVISSTDPDLIMFAGRKQGRV
jgi:hypothetical protein